MKKRLALLHTVVFLADMFRKLLLENLPKVESFHIVDEGIIQGLMAEGKITPQSIRRIGMQALLAQENGADLILFTCSSTSPAVDSLRALIDVPIMKIDEPMARHAISLGADIGVVATAKTTIEPSVRLIESAAKERGSKVRVQSLLESSAFEAKLAGDNSTHDRIVRDAVQRLAKKCDVVVLAQASMAHLAEPLEGEVSVPVLASPKLCISALKELFA
jgi:Asp/Glu/hydantoin racemase